jgi:hypothetical protein
MDCSKLTLEEARRELERLTFQLAGFRDSQSQAGRALEREIESLRARIRSVAGE